MEEGDAGTQPALITTEDSRLSMLNGMEALEHSRMSACASLMPEELAEWRGGGNSSCGELLSSSREVSLDVPSLPAASRSRLMMADHGQSGSGSRLPPLDVSRGAADVDCDRAEGAGLAAAAPEPAQPCHGEPALQAQWMQAECSDSSSDAVADAGAADFAAAQGPCQSGKGKKGTAKGKGGSSAGGAGGKGGRDGAKGAKGAQAGSDGDGKLSGMWTAEENNIFFDGLAAHGRTFPKIHDLLQKTKTKEQVRCYYYRVIKKINQVLPREGPPAVLVSLRAALPGCTPLTTRPMA